MASKGGCNEHFHNPLKNPGTQQKSRHVPSKWARNNLAKGGVNKDPQHKGGKGKSGS